MKIEYGGSLVVGVESLTRITTFLEAKLPGFEFTSKVMKLRREPYAPHSLPAVSTVDNPKGSAIYEIQFSGRRGAASVSYRLGDTPPTVEVITNELSDTESAELRAFVLQECRDTRSFFWPIHVGTTYLSRIPWAVKLTAWLAVASYVLYSRTRLWRRVASDPSAVDQDRIDRVDLPHGSPDDALLSVPVGPIAFGLLLGLIGPPLLIHLFPRIVFNMGEGIDRYRHIVWWRGLLFSTLVLSPLVGYLSR